MAPPRTATATTNANVTTAYSLSLLSEYTHTLDSLPLDLSRNFADLRELDAVLSSSMSSITTKIHKLTTMIEENTSSKDERLWLLGEIAEEATRLKLGGEDKIRVACQAADNLRSHTDHMRRLLEHLPQFDPRELRRRTTYPHIASKAFLPAAGTERGRGRRGGFGSILSSSVESPAKRKRAMRDDDGEHAHHRSPKKDKAVEGSSRHRNPGGRTKKYERAASPTESMISVTSQMPAPSTQYERPNIGNSRLSQTINSSSRAAHNTSSNRRRPSAHHTAVANPPQDDPMDHPNNGNGANGSASRREAFNAPPASSHPSLPHPFSTSTAMHYDMAPTHHLSTPTPDWATHPPPGQLEGPGMPVARSHSIPAPAAPVPAPGDSDRPNEDGDGEPEDTARYCYCNGVSYGEMIGCDGPECELEWFHIGCVGMQSAPNGSWYCDGCKAKKPTRSRGGRGGKKKAVGGRGSAKAVTT